MPGKKKKRDYKAEFRGFKYEKLIGLSVRTKVFEIYPHLQLYPELNPKYFSKSKISFDKALRYVMIYYTDNVLRKIFPEVAHRKREAALLARFEFNANGKFGADIERMLACEIPAVNRMIVRFIRRENKRFMNMCAFEEARAKQALRLIDGTDQKDITKAVIDNVKSLTDDIDRLEKELLGDDQHPDILEMLYDEIDYTNLGISPEEIAEAIRDGVVEKILGNPYKHKNDATRRSNSEV